MREALWYRRAPIIEAVIDIHFTDPLPKRELERLRDRFIRKYPSVVSKDEFQFTIGETDTQSSRKHVGYQLISKDGRDAVIIQFTSLTTSALPPYPGWDTLISTAKENFGQLLKIAARPTVTRIGSRFINRIDVPNKIMHNSSVADLVRVGPAIPDGLASSINNYAFTVNLTEAQHGLGATINVGTQVPQLLGFFSLHLDIDVFIDKEVPLRFEEMWARFSDIREAKNRIFELSITDAVREIIK
jgi:uncharacterized protein (TIGR04255 family)